VQLVSRIRTFIKVHRPQLNRAFKIRWKRPPAHTAIRYILQGLSLRMLKMSSSTCATEPCGSGLACMLWRSMVRRSRVVSITSTTSRQNSAQRVCCQHGFGSGAYRDRRKIKRDPAVQKLLEELDVAGHIVTCDAMHCQKKNLRSRRRRERTSDRSTQRQSADLASKVERLRHDHSHFWCSDR